MTSAPTKEALQSLYRSLLRTARQIPQYNYRSFALRKIKEDFNLIKGEEGPDKLSAFFREESDNLAQMKRILKVQQLYSDLFPKLVIEVDGLGVKRPELEKS